MMVPLRCQDCGKIFHAPSRRSKKCDACKAATARARNARSARSELDTEYWRPEAIAARRKEKADAHANALLARARGPYTPEDELLDLIAAQERDMKYGNSSRWLLSIDNKRFDDSSYESFLADPHDYFAEVDERL